MDRSALNARIQDPSRRAFSLRCRISKRRYRRCAAAGPSTVASPGGRIIIRPRYRVVVASDLNGLYLVLMDQRKTP